mgnify:CR=1 FL=1
MEQPWDRKLIKMSAPGGIGATVWLGRGGNTTCVRDIYIYPTALWAISRLEPSVSLLHVAFCPLASILVLKREERSFEIVLSGKFFC